MSQGLRTKSLRLAAGILLCAATHAAVRRDVKVASIPWLNGELVRDHLPGHRKSRHLRIAGADTVRVVPNDRWPCSRELL